MRDIVIVGAGQCGIRAALTLREEGFSGTITLIGEEPHLPYERPPLSKEALNSAEPLSPQYVAAHAVIEDNTIQMVLNEKAVRVDRAEQAVVLSGGRRLPYDKLLLATGSTPRTLPALAGNDTVHYLRTHDDALALAARLSAGGHLAVIGAGFIGLELAVAARKRGLQVTVIEALPRILMRAVPEVIAREVGALHEANGVRILCDTKIERFGRSAQLNEILLSSGETLLVDAIIVGIGAMPCSDLAEAAALSIENGIAVDGMLQTEDPAIYAAGDCCSFPAALYDGRRIRLEAWRNAQDQGVQAAKNMLGANLPYKAVPWFWSDQYDFTLQIAGLADHAARVVRRQVDEETLILFHLDPTGKLLAASAWGRGNSVARDVRLAEMLIEQGAQLSDDELSSPDVSLKSLLARSRKAHAAA
jgi:3-phenylpropionate/trans-cinnamate dioxygenase ferredoxin reductase subunit